MTQGIYALIHDGRMAYVGCSRDIRRRFNQHHDTLKRGVHKNFKHRAALSAAKLGKPRPDIAAAMTGRKQSPEVVAKRVESFRRSIERRREMTRAAE